MTVSTYFRRAIVAAAACAVLWGDAGSFARADEEDMLRRERSERERILEAIEQDIAASRAAAEALADEIEALRSDRAALNQRLLDTAENVRDSEGRIARLEERLAELMARESVVRDSLNARSGLLAELLGALQRMGRRPAPAVLVSPEDSLRMVRSAMLLGAVLPEMRIETAALANDLEELTGVRREIDEERREIVARTERLRSERAEVAMLLEAKRRNLEESASELADVRARAAELAAQAEDLRELIASLDREIAVAAREALERARQRSPQEALDALRDPGRLEPAIPFEAAQGMLPLPASGPVIRRFGESDQFTASARGVSIAAPPGAQVTSPSDGWVVYAGTFRSYGQLLIVNVGDGYHILLAGMAGISVELGQFVLKGEPVGRMGGVVVASVADVTVGREQPVLYVEFRKDGRSIDPAPWWANGRTGASG